MRFAGLNLDRLWLKLGDTVKRVFSGSQYCPRKAPNRRHLLVLPQDAEVLRSELPKAKLDKPWAISAAVARFLHTEEVTGSIPVWPTKLVFWRA